MSEGGRAEETSIGVKINVGQPYPQEVERGTLFFLPFNRQRKYRLPRQSISETQTNQPKNANLLLLLIW